MKIFDFNIHLPTIIKKTNDKIENEKFLSSKALIENYKTSFSYLKRVSGANFMILNETIFKDKNSKNFFDAIKNDFKYFSVSALVDFRDENVFEYLELLKFRGVKGLKFHSYIQKISDNDFEKVLKVAFFAEKLGFFIEIDTSYGTTGLFKYDNLKLAAFIAEKIKKVPIILLHSGGLRVIEAMLIAEDAKNVFFDTSFSLLYYKDAPFLENFAFAYKKLGKKRVLYGSDFPYIDFDESIDFTRQFFEFMGFSSSNLDDIFFNNAVEILNG